MVSTIDEARVKAIANEIKNKKFEKKAGKLKDKGKDKCWVPHPELHLNRKKGKEYDKMKATKVLNADEAKKLPKLNNVDKKLLLRTKPLEITSESEGKNFST
ncbi:hypothetical protein F0562_013455 [Nyssa sinensis]|uniref:Uncharacterized protein n=1 Tax=Nyssa sinensis TaxID=561372 RepID=A0A5J4ZMM0_9ASTE|nr:hypothetical protein F0562_013455 [Nyssa sinensis]